jgi:hypothetical protein
VGLYLCVLQNQFAIVSWTGLVRRFSWRVIALMQIWKAFDLPHPADLLEKMHARQ